MRSLTLHASALNDAEYDLYTSSLRDLVDSDDTPNDPLSFDDARYEQIRISTREARAWLRGRYNELPVHQIDSILKTIALNNAQGEGLSVRQFFAVMRLVMHARTGKEPDASLVFVQAHPATSPFAKSRRPSPPPQRRADPPAPGPSQLKRASQPPPLRPSNTVVSPPVIPPKPTNPFLNRSRSQDPPLGPFQNASSRNLAGTGENKQPPLPPRKPSIIQTQTQIQAQGPPPPPPPPRHASLNHSNTNVLIQQSLQANRVAQSLKKAEERLQQERVLEVLKTSSNMKRTRSNSPTKDLNLRNTPECSSSSASGSSSRLSDRPALPPRRKATPPLSATSWEQVATASIGPFVPRAKPMSPFFTPSKSQSPFHSPPKVPSDLPPPSPTNSSVPGPPPMHPDRKQAVSLDSQEGPSLPPSPSSNNSTRLFRSKSMHQPVPPPVPPPIRSKKRPESVQLDGNLPPQPQTPSRPTPMTSHNLSRHLSLSSPAHSRPSARDPSSVSDSPMSTVQRALSQFQQKAAPKIDKARYKAEAGLSRRGFVSHERQKWLRREGEEPLMDDPESPADREGGWTNRRVFDDDDEDDMQLNGFERVDGYKKEESGTSEEEKERVWGDRRRNGVQKELGSMREKQMEVPSMRGSREWLYDRDDLKWPAGDGWKPLSVPFDVRI
ncbi:hypothetical protein QCA50_011917 [Cerrena zonata]|uniref:Uncharacterized protein n=1 Tax=Cerrena zonata TaxID=2478898 RepID=A0AAW0FUZ1_9APHY